TTAPATTAPVAAAVAPGTASAAPASGAPRKAEAEGKSEEEIALKTVDYDDKGKVVFGGVSEPGSQVQVYVNNKLAGKTKTDSDGTWAVKPEANVAPGTHTVRIDKVETSGRVLARVELPFMRSEPLRDLPPGAVVVVQPGNSLWRIASRIYGSGVRYTDIYQANLGQIGDPDMIYPGQVFGLPKVN
ncbi:MAG: LysM peptidoglycan-binding domain-containing protein, partial [Rhodospirillaceae bacterium]|nr:LysM peptidoglycan-binding domain-containing protein [Rhodospirillaceae bacterium]